jgi:WD40 repeat protein
LHRVSLPGTLCYNLPTMSRKVIFSLLPILALAAIALALWYFIGQSQGHEAVLSPQEGSVRVKTRFNTVSLSRPRALKVGEGNEIQTGADSSALIVFSPGASAELGSDTEVILRRLSWSEDDSPIVELEMQRGDTWHELSSSGPEMQYQILTPSARVTRSSGRYHVSVSDDGSTRVEVSLGWAMVKAQSTEVEVQQGEYTSVPPGRAPSIPRSTAAWYLFVSERKGNSDIWRLDEQGNEVQLTDSRADDLAPAWSPDGTKIAFESLRDGNSEIYAMNYDGSGQVNLTQNSAPDHTPTWSPDGTKIAFESLRDGAREIYVMNADGSEPTRLTFGPGLNVAPHWTTDGQGIVFTRIEGDTNGDGFVNLADMGNFFFVDVGGSVPQAVWTQRMIFEQMIYPWGRRMVGG